VVRPLRQLISGEAYHLTSRGVDKRVVFLDDRDRRNFVRRLGATADDRDVSCLAYCLMSNHVHLVMRGSSEELSSLMRDVLGGYARYFNKRHGRSGHLFSSRFRDVHIASDAQLHAVLRYVALNPVRAGMVEHPRDWPWSSFAALASGTFEPGAVDLRALGILLTGNMGPLPAVVDALLKTVDMGLDAARRDALAAGQRPRRGSDTTRGQTPGGV